MNVRLLVIALIFMQCASVVIGAKDQEKKNDTAKRKKSETGESDDVEISPTPPKPDDDLDGEFDRNKNFEHWCSLGRQAYLANEWKDCVLYMERALEDYRLTFLLSCFWLRDAMILFYLDY